MTLRAKNIDHPDEQRSFERAQVRLVKLPGATVSVATFRPGWRWSIDFKPHVDAESCQMHHIAYVIAGRIHVRMDDGRELDLGPGDAHVVSPGHDAWVLGDEPCVTVDFIPAGGDVSGID